NDGNKGLLFYPDVRPLDLVGARVVLELLTYLTVFAIIMGAVALVDERFAVDSLLLTMVGFDLTGGLGTGLGLVLCGLSTFYDLIDGNKGLLFYPDVRPLDLVGARVVLELLTYLTVFAIIMGAVALVDERFAVDSLLLTMVGFGLTAGLGTGLGLVLCGLSTF